MTIRNIGIYLKYKPRVYAILKNKQNNFSPKLFRSAKSFTDSAEFHPL